MDAKIFFALLSGLLLGVLFGPWLGFSSSKVNECRITAAKQNLRDFVFLVANSSDDAKVATGNPLGIVKKTQYSSHARFLFVASMGGTGHHGWGEAVENGDVCQEALPVFFALKALWFGPDNEADTFADELKEKMRATIETAEPGQIFCLNLLHRHFLSYPNLNHKVHHPDVYSLARIAEEAGVDIRFIVLHRHPAPQLVSLSIHRNYLQIHEEAQQMVNQGGILNSQLLTIDPEFYVCAGFSSALDVRDSLQQHLFGGMKVVAENKLSKALASYYNAGEDDIDLAWEEIKNDPNGESIEIKIGEMEVYYRYLKDKICQRQR